MEDFSLDMAKKSTEEDRADLNMQVSPICHRDGEKIAYVTFSDKSRYAEGEIPRCVIVKNKGFSKAEVFGLEEYMEQNLKTLKSMAASVNPLKALMKD